MQVPSRAFLNKLVKNIRAGAGADSISLAACAVGLTKAAISPTIDTVLADLTEADYDGYARVTMGTMSQPFVGPDDLSLTEAAAIQFRPGSDTTTPNTIFAAFLVGAGSDSQTLYLTEPLDAPVPLTGTGTALTYLPRAGFDPAANYGKSLASS